MKGDFLKWLVEAKELFGDMRDSTPEENKAINKYISEISEDTGVNFFDFVEENDKE